MARAAARRAAARTAAGDGGSGGGGSTGGVSAGGSDDGSWAAARTSMGDGSTGGRSTGDSSSGGSGDDWAGGADHAPSKGRRGRGVCPLLASDPVAVRLGDEARGDEAGSDEAGGEEEQRRGEDPAPQGRDELAATGRRGSGEICQYCRSVQDVS